MATPREIPGFYYDAEKDKYFRIQADHRAPTGSAYSRSAVKAEKESLDRQTEARKREDRFKYGRISHPGRSSYTDLSFRKCLGHGVNENFSLIQTTYAASLERRSARIRSADKLATFTVSASGAVFVATVYPNEVDAVCTYVQSNEWPLNYERMSPERTPRRLGLNLATTSSNVLLSTHGPILTLESYLTPTDTWYVSTRYHIGDATIWDLGVPPNADSTRFAVAATNGLHHGDASGHCPFGPCESLRSEQMALTWKDNSVVVSGERNGAVHLTDIRVASSVHRLHHWDSVNGLAARYGRSENHILVSGLRSMSLYDLRYSKAAKPCPTKRRHNHKSKHIQSFEPTKPLLNFHVPEHRWSSCYTSGNSLAYSASLDIAVLTSQATKINNTRNREPMRQSAITIYQVSSGRILPSPLTSTSYDQKITGVSFARLRDGPESILVGTESSLEEWNVDLPARQFDGTDLRVPVHKEISDTLNGDQLHRNFALGEECFPPDPQSDMNEKWARGDHGPT